MSVVLPDIHCRPEWPFESYASAWLQFRALTDENRVTADHILSRSGWPRTLPNLRMADFGCGDGRLIETLLSTVQQPVSTVHLTDINPELLEQASERIKRLKSVQYVDAVCQSAGDAMLRMANDIDAALAVHLLYLPGEDETRRFLTALAPGVTLFIVLDHPESVFMRLLEKTAPMYYARSLNAHRTIEGLHEHGYRMEKTEFDTHLVNPLGLEDERRDAVLSLLCYRDFRALDSETRSWVGAVVSEHERSGQIVCKCVCYELMRG